MNLYKLVFLIGLLSMIGSSVISPSHASQITNSNASSIDSIASENSDISIFPSVNHTKDKVKVTEGTLEINDISIPIKYNLTDGIPVFEEDIILTNKIVDGKAAVDKFINGQKWSNGEIPFAIHPDIPNKDRIIQALNYVQDHTNIKFKNLQVSGHNVLDPNYVLFVPHSDQCSSRVGMIGGEQQINVADWCRTGNMIHEIGHLIGLLHPQTRCDRDQYIEIEWNNIPDYFKYNFETVCDPNDPNSALSPISFGPYDYCSIMHYPSKIGNAINSDDPVIKTLKPVSGCDGIGQREQYSQGDIAAIDSTYDKTFEGSFGTTTTEPGDAKPPTTTMPLPRKT